MIDIKNVIPGEAYGCKFKLNEYEGFGFLKQRDLDNQLVVIVDSLTGREFTVPFDKIWDIDDIQFTEEP